MTTYEAGTVAVVTWDNASVAQRDRGKSDLRSERAIRTEDGYWALTSHHLHCIGDSTVTDIRPLVVLDLDDPSGTVASLREGAADDLWTGEAAACIESIADQIEAQPMPPRIPEPGLWGVVRDATGEEWVRTGPTQHTSYEWLNTETADSDDWAGIKAPTLVRPGIEDES